MHPKHSVSMPISPSVLSQLCTDFFHCAGKLQPEAGSILFRSDMIMSFNNIIFHIQTAYSAQLSLVLLS